LFFASLPGIDAQLLFLSVFEHEIHERGRPLEVALAEFIFHHRQTTSQLLKFEARDDLQLFEPRGQSELLSRFDEAGGGDDVRLKLAKGVAADAKLEKDQEHSLSAAEDLFPSTEGLGIGFDVLLADKTIANEMGEPAVGRLDVHFEVQKLADKELAGLELSDLFLIQRIVKVDSQGWKTELGLVQLGGEVRADRGHHFWLDQLEGVPTEKGVDIGNRKIVGSGRKIPSFAKEKGLFHQFKTFCML